MPRQVSSFKKYIDLIKRIKSNFFLRSPKLPISLFAKVIFWLIICAILPIHEFDPFRKFILVWAMLPRTSRVPIWPPLSRTIRVQSTGSPCLSFRWRKNDLTMPLLVVQIESVKQPVDSPWELRKANAANLITILGLPVYRLSQATQRDSFISRAH